MDLFPVHASPDADLPAVVPVFGDPSLGFDDQPLPVTANARFSGVLHSASTGSFVPGVGFGHLTSSFDGLTLKFGALSKAADKTHAAFLRNTELHRLERRRGAYEIIGAAAALGSIVERTIIAPALQVESAIHSAADERGNGRCPVVVQDAHELDEQVDPAQADTLHQPCFTTH